MVRPLDKQLAHKAEEARRHLSGQFFSWALSMPLPEQGGKVFILVWRALPKRQH